MTAEELKTIVAAIRAELRPKKWLCESEAARYLGVSPSTMAEMRKSGRVRGGLIGARWKYREADLDAAVLMPGRI